MPLNLIASILGMSEFTAMTEKLPWPMSYGIFSLLMVVIGFFTYKFITSFSTRELRHPRRRRRKR
jgi:magnesium transporter